MESIAALRHRPLSQDIPRHDKGGVYFLHDFLCLLEHGYFAVDAGVRVFTIPVNRIPDQIDIFLPHVDHAEINPDGFRDPGGMGFVLIPEAFGKGGREVEADDMETLFHDDLCRQDAVQPSRNERHRIHLHTIFPAI